MIGDSWTPREGNGGVPVNIQDQSTKMLNLYFIKQLGASTTLSAKTTVDLRTIQVANATGFSAGNYIGIFGGVGRFYFGHQIGAPSGSTLTLDTPLDYEFAIGATVLNFTKEMAVNGSTAPQVFQIGPIGSPVGLRIDITKLVVSVVDNLEPDDSKFGGIAALTNGCVLRKRNGVYDNEANWKTNRDIGLYAGVAPSYTDKAGGGYYGAYFDVRFAGQQNRGVTRRLNAGDVLDLIVQDDLTGLVSFQVMAQGHIVEDRFMANPVIISIPAAVWTKVATSVLTGAILPTKRDAHYVYTIRDTGDPAPTNGDYTEAKELEYEGEKISASAPIDVYLSVSSGSVDGEVRVDL